MNNISPKYLMKLVTDIDIAIWKEYNSYENVALYIDKWHVIEQGDWNNYYENFAIKKKSNGQIDLKQTLHDIQDELLLKIAIDVGVDTPDFIPSVPMFKNEIKSNYISANATFEKALKQIEVHPDIAIGLANSALESIIKEILKDERMSSKIKGNETMYVLSTVILKEFRLLSDTNLPKEIKTIGNSLLTINQSIEKIRSEKTDFHGKTQEDYVIEDPLYTYFIVNSVTTIGLFLNSYYKLKFPKPIVEDNKVIDDLPF